MSIQLVHVTVDAGGLRLSGSTQPVAGVVDAIRASKGFLLDAAPCVLVFTDEAVCLAEQEQPPHWLDELAAILKCDAAYLLERGFIDCHDLIEQDGSDPEAMADLIRSHPDWQPQIDWKAIGRQYAKATTYTAAVASPDWLLVRDAFQNHWAACLDCCPPTNRYCPAGAALKARYEEITERDREQPA